MKSPAPRKPRSKVHKPHLSTASDARAVRSREQIRKAFLELLETTALNDITIREICAKASLNYVTFFRHYQTKESLLEDIAADEVKRLVELTLPVFNAENTAAAAVTLCRYIDDHRKLWTTLFVGGAAESVRRTLIDLSRKVSHAHKDSEGWPPKEVAVAIFVASTVELLTWWLQQKKPVPVAEVAQIFEGFIVTPALTAAVEHANRKAGTKPSASSK
jgi:AcrR family transcriptional regulator